MRVVYAGRLHGEVLATAPEAYQAKLRLDNGTVEWFRSDLMVPEGEHDPVEPTPGAWRDRAGFLWLEASEPGSRQVFCYDAPVRRRMGDKWPTMTLEDAEAEFGPMTPMAAVQEGPQEGDRVVFLPWGGRDAMEVPAEYAAARGYEWEGRRDHEIAPGVRAILLACGEFTVPSGETVSGAYVVIRKAG